MKYIKTILWKLFFINAILLLTINTVLAFQNLDTEKERLQWHLDRTENILRKVDTSNLNQNQKENRKKMLDLLEGYTKEWKFPNNDKFPWKYVPFFRWSNGNLCAVWYLMYSDPEYKDYVDTIVKTNNNVQVMNIKNDIVFNSWLEKYGFSQLETAMIQPSYKPYYKPSVFEIHFQTFFSFWWLLSLGSFMIIWIFRRKHIHDIFLKISFLTWFSIIALILINDFTSMLWYHTFEILWILWILLIIFVLLFVIWIWRQWKNSDIYLKILLIIMIIFILCVLIDIFPFLYGKSW